MSRPRFNFKTPAKYLKNEQRESPRVIWCHNQLATTTLAGFSKRFSTVEIELEYDGVDPDSTLKTRLSISKVNRGNPYE